MNFSLEIGPKTDLETVPPLSDVYITMLPGGDYKETADKAAELCCFICSFFIISSWKHSDIDIT